MKRIASFLFAATLAAFAALRAAAMTWSVNPSNSNQIIDDTGSWTLTLANFNNTYDGVQFNGKQIDGVAYEEKGANGVIDLTTVEVDTGLKIVSIGAHKFGRSSSGTPNTFLKEVYLPDTIGYWGQGTFRFCTALEKIGSTANCRKSLPNVAATRPNTALALCGRARPAGCPAAGTAA